MDEKERKGFSGTAALALSGSPAFKQRWQGEKTRKKRAEVRKVEKIVQEKNLVMDLKVVSSGLELLIKDPSLVEAELNRASQGWQWHGRSISIPFPPAHCLAAMSWGWQKAVLVCAQKKEASSPKQSVGRIKIESIFPQSPVTFPKATLCLLGKRSALFKKTSMKVAEGQWVPVCHINPIDSLAVVPPWNVEMQWHECRRVNTTRV